MTIQRSGTEAKCERRLVCSMALAQACRGDEMQKHRVPDFFTIPHATPGLSLVTTSDVGIRARGKRLVWMRFVSRDPEYVKRIE